VRALAVDIGRLALKIVLCVERSRDPCTAGEPVAAGDRYLICR